MFWLGLVVFFLLITKSCRAPIDFILKHELLQIKQEKGPNHPGFARFGHCSCRGAAGEHPATLIT